MKTKVIKLRERRKKKLSNVKRYKRKRLMLISTFFIVSGVAVWLIYSSNFFSVAEIRVRGNKNISDQKIIESSGIKQNDSLITLPSAKIANQLKKFNWIERAVAVRDWPDTVILEVDERKPVAYLQTNKGSYLIDKKSFVIDKQSKYQIKRPIAKIEGLSMENVKTGQHIKNKALKNAVAAYQSLDQDLRQNIYNITANSVDELYFIVQGIEIIYGEAVKTGLKNKVIKTILKEKKENISTIDVRIPDKPVVRVIGS